MASVQQQVRELKRQFEKERQMRKLAEDEVHAIQRKLRSNLSESNLFQLTKSSENLRVVDQLSGEFGDWQRKLARVRAQEAREAELGQNALGIGAEEYKESEARRHVKNAGQDYADNRRDGRGGLRFGLVG